MEIVKWIGEHSNKVRSAIWQAILLSVAFRWITVEEAQLAVLGMFLDAMLGLFVETNTVSKVRVGERITEVQEKLTSTGHGTSNSNLVILCAVVLASAAAVGCASSPKPRVVTAYQSAQIGLGALQGAEMVVYKSGTLPALTEEKHRQISRLFARAFDMQMKFGPALKVWEPGVTMPVGYTEWIASVENVVLAINELVPKDASLINATVEWARQVVAIVRALGQIVPPPLAAVVR